MKKLTPEYWKAFEIERDGKTRKSGAEFEKLVEDILTEMYQGQHILFEATQTTHDGSKDFKGSKDGKEIVWAECKNYKKTLSLTQIAPTLVMAEIYGIKTVLFFSYSPLSREAAEHLCRYRHKDRALTFYDGEALESLILSLPAIMRTYFPDYCGKLGEQEILEPYLLCGFEKDPALHLVKPEDEGDWKAEMTLPSLSIGDIFSANIMGVNRDGRHFIFLEVRFLSMAAAPDDLYCFTFLDERIKRCESGYSFTVCLSPGSTLYEQIFIRYSKFKPAIYPPAIEISVRDQDGNTLLKKTFSPPALIQTNWTRKAVFSGSGYEHQLQIFREKCVDCRHFAGALFYGKSGTGKTRLLEECIHILLSRQYKILNFTGREEWSITQVISEIVYILYGFSKDMVLESVAWNTSGQSFQRPDVQKALELLQALQKDDISEEELKGRYSLIHEKLMQDNYTLIFDDLQYFKPPVLSFLREFLSRGVNRGRPSKALLLCAINLDQVTDDAFYEFISEYDALRGTVNSHFICERVQGFQTSLQALSFLASILRMPVGKMDSPALRQKLEHCSLRPKYIEEVAEYLIMQNAVVFSQGEGVVSEPVHFLDVLTQLPSKFKDLFPIRFKWFCKRCAEKQLNITESFLPLLSVVHLFKLLDYTWMTRLGLPEQAAVYLLQGGILRQEERDGTSWYRFEHDLVEQYFIEQPSFFPKAMDVLDSLKDLSLLRLEYPAQYCLYCFYRKCVDSGTVRTVFSALEDISVPSKLERIFYNQLIEWLLCVYRTKQIGALDFINYVTAYCIHIRDFIGEAAAKTAFSKCYAAVKRIEVSHAGELKAHFAFVIHYCENRNHFDTASVFEENITIYQDYIAFLKDALPRFPEVEREIRYGIAYLQNRVFICGKHLGRSACCEDGLSSAIKTGEELHFPDILFSCYFDRSSALLYVDRAAALDSFRKGLSIFEENRYPQYELNYFKKKIHYHLLTHELEPLPGIFKKAFDYLKSSKAVKYQVYFRTHFLQLKVIYLLLKNESVLQTQQMLEELHLSQLLLNKENDYITLFLTAKFTQRSAHPIDAIPLYCRALSQCRRRAAEKNYLRDHFNCKIIREELMGCVCTLPRKQQDSMEPALREQLQRALEMELPKKAWTVLCRRGTEPRRSAALIVSDDGTEGFLL